MSFLPVFSFSVYTGIFPMHVVTYMTAFLNARGISCYIVHLGNVSFTKSLVVISESTERMLARTALENASFITFGIKIYTAWNSTPANRFVRSSLCGGLTPLGPRVPWSGGSQPASERAASSPRVASEGTAAAAQEPGCPVDGLPACPRACAVGSTVRRGLCCTSGCLLARDSD